MDLRPILQQQITAVGKKVAQITPDTHTKPTPCSEFDVKALGNHLVGGHYVFAAIANGAPLDISGPAPDLIGDDAATAVEGSMKVFLDAINGEGVLDRTFVFPFSEMPAAQGLGVMLMETVVHGWDLAKGLGIDATIDPMLATMMLENLKKGGIEDLRGPGKPFGPEVEVPADASPTDKLVAFLGRTP